MISSSLMRCIELNSKLIRRMLVRTRTPLRGVSRGYVHGLTLVNQKEEERAKLSSNKGIYPKTP